MKSYQADRKTQAAVERKCEIIGGALNRIRSVDEGFLEQIRDFRSIISFRNILAHGYDTVEDRIVWGIIENDLDELIEDLRSLLQAPPRVNKEMHRRKGIEGTQSELVRGYGLRQARYRGQARVRLQNYLIGTVCNICRLFRRLAWKSNEARRAAGAAMAPITC